MKTTESMPYPPLKKWRGPMLISYEEDDTLTIRAALRRDPDEKILYKCFNRAEADAIATLLTAEELARVTFTWIRFRA